MSAAFDRLSAEALEAATRASRKRPHEVIDDDDNHDDAGGRDDDGESDASM